MKIKTPREKIHAALNFFNQDFLQHFAQPAASVQHFEQVAESLQQPPSHFMADLSHAPPLQHEAQPLLSSSPTAQTAPSISIFILFSFRRGQFR